MLAGAKNMLMPSASYEQKHRTVRVVLPTSLRVAEVEDRCWLRVCPHRTAAVRPTRTALFVAGAAWPSKWFARVGAVGILGP
eukprot:COSAG02_NODE_40161_length_408_cov_1.281553_1_plen_81_part_10